MISKISIIFLSFCALASAGIVSVPTVEVLQGPSSKTTLVGPDGSSISSVAPGGTVVIGGQTVVPAAPVVVAAPATVVAGPSGSVITSYSLAGPAVLSAVAPVAVAAAGEGLEGQYIPDNTEQLYDDGSYKGE